jgi:N-acyl-L-homoserine lactone synthetase
VLQNTEIFGKNRITELHCTALLEAGFERYSQFSAAECFEESRFSLL